MNSVTQFAQYLLRLDPQKSPGRLALFHYLKHVIDPLEPFGPDVIERFYAQSLNFEYWQTHSESLAQEVRQDLAAYPKHAKLDKKEFSNIRHCDALQIIILKHLPDFEDLVMSLETSRRK